MESNCANGFLSCRFSDVLILVNVRMEATIGHSKRRLRAAAFAQFAHSTLKTEELLALCVFSQLSFFVFEPELQLVSFAGATQAAL